MRVALLSYNGQARDAIGNGLAEKLRFFLERGADVRVFVQSAVRLHPVLAPHCQVVEEVQQAGPTWDFLAGADLVSFEFSQAYELLHYLPLLAGRKPRLVVDYHGVSPARHWPAPQRAALQSGAAQQGLVWCADHVVAHSRFMRRELVRATRFPDERIHQLDFPLPAAFHAGAASWSLRAHLGLGDARLLLFVGRLAPNKNVPVLVEALARLRDSAPEVHAIVVGDTSDIYAGELRRCRDLARQLGVDNRVHFLGSLTEERLADCYRDADLLVIPSAHEGFCIPIAEAQACGLPVIAARATALPETVGGAGLTFALGDIQDLASQVRRVLWDGPPEPSVQPDGSGEPSHDAAIASPQRKIAIVCFRFGDDIVGGAETSLRKIALALQGRGESVEVFTTCNRAESAWANELPATTARQEGLVVHRFPIDPHDRERHLQSVRSVIESDGQVLADEERAYLAHSIHSAALIASLRARADEFKAIITGPYLFGLTCDVAEAFPGQTLVLPCFHEEPLAHLKTWPLVYGRVAGVLFHSPEERELAQSELGINHPNSVEIGTFLADLAAPTRKADPFSGERYLVYCGRYSEQKCLSRLLEYMARYRSEHPERFDMVFMGTGEVRLPAQAWARDLGRVDEDAKHAVLAGAAALVQLSRQESLSLVVLEAWAQGTPVLVDERCSVLAGQLRRCQGGAACADYESFAQALDDLWDNPAAWQERGRRGQAYVRQRYSSQADFSTAILTAVEAIDKPLAEQMRRRGLARAARSARPSWQARFGAIVERVLHGEARHYNTDASVAPVRTGTIVKPARRTLLPVRVHNRGTHAVCADGPARQVIFCAIGDSAAGSKTSLAGLLMPRQTQSLAVSVTAPGEPGEYPMRLWIEREDATAPRPALPNALLSVSQDGPDGCTAPFLEAAHEALAEAEILRELPDDYVDVTEGRFARCKRWLKAKMIGNFKRGYVDVLSHQQSRVNRQLVVAVQQLAECCATLDHAVHGLQERLDRMDDPPVSTSLPDSRHTTAVSDHRSETPTTAPGTAPLQRPQ